MFKGFKTRKPWATALIGVVFGPVAGMLYLNRGRLAVCYFAGLLALIACCFAAAHYQLTRFDPRTSFTVCSWLLQLAGAFHGYVIAKHRGAGKLNWYSRWYSIILLCFVLPTLVVTIFRHGYYEPFSVGSPSMQPALQPEEYFIVDRHAYMDHAPERGDVVVFKVSLANGVVEYVKRIVGMSGDKIQMKEGTLIINDKPLPRRDLPETADGKLQFVEILPEGKEITLQEDKDSLPGANPNNISAADEQNTVYNVPQGQYFVIGDYAGHSSDSRNGLGNVGRQFIVGKAIAIIWNNKTFRFSYRPIE